MLLTPFSCFLESIAAFVVILTSPACHSSYAFLCVSSLYRVGQAFLPSHRVMSRVVSTPLSRLCLPPAFLRVVAHSHWHLGPVRCATSVRFFSGLLQDFCFQFFFGTSSAPGLPRGTLPRVFAGSFVSCHTFDAGDFTSRPASVATKRRRLRIKHQQIADPLDDSALCLLFMLHCTF